MMSDSSQDRWQKLRSMVEPMMGLGLAIGFLVLFILIFSGGVISGILCTVFILLIHHVIPIPRGTISKREEEEELARRIQELEHRYPAQMHPDWQYGLAEWSESRRRAIKERAFKEMKVDRRAKAIFPLNLPWWGRALASVPWLLAVAGFVASRPSSWPAFETIPGIILAIVEIFVGLFVGILVVVQIGMFLEKRLSQKNFDRVKLGFWVALFSLVFFFYISS